VGTLNFEAQKIQASNESSTFHVQMAIQSINQLYLERVTRDSIN